MADLSSVRALVTGATSGLGRAMAQALADAGARVIVTGRDPERTRAAAAEIGGAAQPLAFDVRDPAAVAAGADEAWATLGQIDLLVNNAGIGMRTVNPKFMSEPQPFWEVTPEGFTDVLETKANGTFLVARAIVPRMVAAGSGRVVTISMNEQTMVRRGFVPYGPSGAAVEAIGRVIAADLADTPVRANLLLPGGATATGMTPDGVAGAVHPRGGATLLDPAIMGPPIVWLASDAAADVHDERIVATQFEAWLAARG